MSKELIDNLFELQVDSLNKKSRRKFRNTLHKLVEDSDKNVQEWKRYFWQYFGEEILLMRHEDVYSNNILSMDAKNKFEIFFEENSINEIFSLLEWVYSSFSKFIEKHTKENIVNKIFSENNKTLGNTVGEIFLAGTKELVKAIKNENIREPMFEKNINKILSEEKITYTFNKGKFVPHYPKEAQTSIDEAMNLKHENPANHIKKAVALLERHQTPITPTASKKASARWNRWQ